MDKTTQQEPQQGTTSGCGTSGCGSHLRSHHPSHNEDDDGAPDDRLSTKNDDDDDDKQQEHTVLAVIKEGGGIVIFDITGSPKSYHHGDPNLCFEQHDNNSDSNVPSHSSGIYCITSDGRHGPPDELCFCGLSEPHLHAHSKQYCHDDDLRSQTNKNAVLYPDDDESQYKLQISEHAPVSCVQKSLLVDNKKEDCTVIGIIQHDNHHDNLVHHKPTDRLHLEHENCADCGETDWHGQFEKIASCQIKNAIVFNIYRIQKNTSQILQKSALYVSGICCASEGKLIERVLTKKKFLLENIRNISVNTTTKIVYVDHTPNVTTEQISQLLSSQGFGNEIRQDSRSSSSSHAQTTVLCSCLELQLLPKSNGDAVVFSTHWLDPLVQSGQLRGYQCDDDSDDDDVSKPKKLLRVEHCPFDGGMTIQQLQDYLLEQHGMPSSIQIDGLEELLQSKKKAQEAQHASNNNRNRFPRPAVIASGIFWIVSMLSLLGGEKLEHLKWFALLSVAFGIPTILCKAVRTLMRYQFDANCLMLFASLGALALQEFTEAAAVVFLFSLGEWLEIRASARARNALSAILELRPDTADLVLPNSNNQIMVVPPEVVPVGSLVSVKTGSKIPCDGLVADGESTVDESSLTGESRPIRKAIGSKVSGGTVNAGLQPLLIRTTATADDSAVSRLVRLVQMAQVNRSETERMVDHFAKYYTPIVVLGALLMCTLPWAFGKGVEWTHNGLILIVVACPCALIISTPVCYVAGLTAAAQNGVLIKGGAFLEALGSVKTICFDKTGTLTNGEFCLLNLQVLSDSMSRATVFEYLTVMEERASHPVAQAILAASKHEGAQENDGLKLEKHKIVNGEGVVGVVDGKEVNVGNERMFERLRMDVEVSPEHHMLVEGWKAMGGTVGYMSVEGHGIVCAYCAADGVRDESKRVVESLKNRNVNIVMLTGDNHDAADAIGHQVGLEPSEIKSKLLPEEKLNYVKALTDEKPSQSSFLSKLCSKKQLVLMCGDGLNDAPALAAAHVGVAMGEGAALSMETADITLLDSNLEKIEYSIQLGRRVTGKIFQNVFFSLLTKFVVLGFALAGRTELWAAIATDVGSMLLVTLNAMTILPRKRTIVSSGNGDIEDGKLESLKSPGITIGGSPPPLESCSKGCCDSKEDLKSAVCSKDCSDSEEKCVSLCDDGKNPSEDSGVSKNAELLDCKSSCCDSKQETEVDSCPKGCCRKNAKVEVAEKGWCGSETQAYNKSCNEGCCSMKKTQALTEYQKPLDAKPCEKSCCSSEKLAHAAEKSSYDKGCCSTENQAHTDPCEKGCCSSSEEAETKSSNKGCCSTEKPAVAQSCAKGCCSENQN